MKKSTQFAIFGTILLSFIFLLNYFVFWSWAFLLHGSENWCFWILVSVSSIIYPVTMVADMMIHSRWMYILSFFSALWMGIILESFFILLLYTILRPFFTIDRWMAAIVIFNLVLWLTVISLSLSLYIHTRKIELHTSRLSRDLRIVQLSDLHLGSTHRIKYLKRVIHIVNSLAPEVVLITGDFADDARFYQKETLQIFNSFHAPVYMSLGNHETYLNLDLNTISSQGKIKILKNEVLDLGDYQLIGIDDGYTAYEIGKLLGQLAYDKSKYTILLHHRPVGFIEASTAGVDLMLSGHTHQGQFFPFNFLVGLAWKKSRGLYSIGPTSLYVSPGTGTWGPPLRFGSFNEITLFTLNGEKSTSKKNTQSHTIKNCLG